MGINLNDIAEDITPDPISLLESNRNLGYSIEEAIADLIDNSISAKSKNIIFELHWNNGVPFFILKDDGNGMFDELVDSFKLGSKSLEERDSKDLGRFGFGMKTASLSQSRILTVISKKESCPIIARSLDLDFIANSSQGWKLKYPDPQLLLSQFEYLNEIKSGTVIRWDNWDRAPKLESDFIELNLLICNYISVCFHRFIEKGLKIFCNSVEISPCSPIPPLPPQGEGAIRFSTVRLSLNNEAQQTSYILQHPKYWLENYDNSIRINSFKLFEGFERQQGIYIYRCDRLLTPKGGWLGLINKGNASKLARVVIDYPNNADNLWSLDITKTNTSIPYEFKRSIKDLILASKNESLKKINRGIRQIKNNLAPRMNSLIWVENYNQEFDSLNYSIDINHPIFKFYIKEKKISEADLRGLLTTISENLPISKIIQNNDDDSFKHDRIVKNDLLSLGEVEVAKKIFEFKCREMTAGNAFNWLLFNEPYCYYEDQLKQIFREILQ